MAVHVGAVHAGAVDAGAVHAGAVHAGAGAVPTGAPGPPSQPSSTRTCSIARTLDVVGEKWALLAIREVFLGNRRFDEMVRRTGASRDTLTARLKTLVAAGVLERRRYHEHPERFEYVLTAAGRELFPVLLTLLRWGDEHLAGDQGPPLELLHHGRHRVVADVVCVDCGQPVDVRDVVPVAARPEHGSVGPRAVMPDG